MSKTSKPIPLIEIANEEHYSTPKEKEEQYYTPKELAKLLEISESLLNKLRLSGKGPKYIKFSHRIVRYPVMEVTKYMNARIRTSTSDVSQLNQ